MEDKCGAVVIFDELAFDEVLDQILADDSVFAIEAVLAL